MQPQDISWAYVFLTLGPALITGASTALGSWLLYRQQLKSKVAEIEGQTQLRARELLFESYQKRIERREESLKELVSALMGAAGHLQGTTDEEGKRQLEQAMLVLLRMINDPYLDSLNDLEEELTAVGLIDKRQKDISFIRQTFSVDLEKVDSKLTGELYVNFMKALGLYHSLKDELLNKKCEDLFLPISNQTALQTRRS